MHIITTLNKKSIGETRKYFVHSIINIGKIETWDNTNVRKEKKVRDLFVNTEMTENRDENFHRVSNVAETTKSNGVGSRYRLVSFYSPNPLPRTTAQYSHSIVGTWLYFPLRIGRDGEFNLRLRKEEWGRNVVPRVYTGSVTTYLYNTSCIPQARVASYMLYVPLLLRIILLSTLL